MARTATATIVAVVDVGLGHESAERPYLEFDLTIDGRTRRIATGERIEYVHLAHIAVGRDVVVCFDPEQPGRLRIDWDGTLDAFALQTGLYAEKTTGPRSRTL